MTVLKVGTTGIVPTSKVRKMPGQPRTHFDQAGIEKLAKTYLSAGQIDACTVMLLPASKRGSKPYMLLSGERRFRACELAGMDVKVSVVKYIADNTKRLLAATVSNTHHEDLTPLDRAKTYDTLVKGGMTQQEVATAMGVSDFQVASTIALLKLPALVKKLMDPSIPEKRRLPASVGYELVKGLDGQAEKQLQLAKKYRSEGLRMTDLQAMIKAARSAAGKGVKGTRARTPRRQRAILKRYVERVLSEVSDLKRSCPKRVIVEMFEHQPPSERKQLLRKLGKICDLHNELYELTSETLEDMEE